MATYKGGKEEEDEKKESRKLYGAVDENRRGGGPQVSGFFFFLIFGNGVIYNSWKRCMCNMFISLLYSKFNALQGVVLVVV